ncbi:ATP-dependent DNA ligase (plasmid) [Variovorax sp. PBS-H4]|uniref:hypothetical protein n=1 Tax=Variovorax sp. PBS-H4 TaxID=434008 RepID=UPI0013164E4B|nr:hypothetical protein [Variovorax sp. PBS-H4]VTU41408.1 ATP-dependent DNA ligase [Variovorax sp. PBS-H4]
MIAGLHRDGQLIMVGRTVPLTAVQSRSLGEVLQPAGAVHPWPDQISSTRWSKNRSTQPLTKVEPTVVVEVAADTGLQAGVWRHPLRYIRVRADLRATDLPQLR